MYGEGEEEGGGGGIVMVVLVRRRPCNRALCTYIICICNNKEYI